MKLILSIILGLIAGTAFAYSITPAKAQSWTEMVFVTKADGTTSICTIVYANGGRTRHMTCTP